MNDKHIFYSISDKNKHLLLLLIAVGSYIWSGIHPTDRTVWFLDSIPAILFVIILLATYKKFTFSTFVYFMILIHILILLTGAKYMYQMNPLFDRLMNIFDLSRNHFDRVGHFAQGLIPALMAKELLLRLKYFKRSKMFYFIVFCIVLAISAFYELLEFSFAKVFNIPANIVLATQGDVWDTQWDMVMALLGAITSLAILAPIHDKYILKMSNQ
ncbi:MAG: DUF2238 domain-containing protein [Clostridiales bacterium]|nr:DUF2238 domain-containing protein [Clostridiales bacterium]